jgi:hypothetical protein
MPLGLNILICGEGKTVADSKSGSPRENASRNLARDCRILIVQVNGAKPMITVGDDNLRVGGISYQEHRRQLLAGLNFLLVLINVRVAHAQEWQTR